MLAARVALFIDKTPPAAHSHGMSAVTFDTLRLSKDLEAAGFTSEQASGVAEALAKTMSDSVVTQSYLDLRLAEVKADILATKADILKWMFAALLGQAAIIAALVKLI